MDTSPPVPPIDQASLDAAGDFADPTDYFAHIALAELVADSNIVDVLHEEHPLAFAYSNSVRADYALTWLEENALIDLRGASVTDLTRQLIVLIKASRS